MAKTIGIDLGTTNSVIAFIDGTKVETIPNASGSRTTPSVVYYKEDEIIVGELAKRQFVTDPSNVVKSIKRIMGKRFEEISEDVVRELPYRIARLDDDMVSAVIGNDRKMRPEDVSADILEALVEYAENFLGESVTDVVITVPAHFNDQQRTATKSAAKSAGLNVLRIINEPTAAALAFGLDNNKDGTYAIFDFGGGTFDVSVLSIKGDIYEVLSTNGDNRLGGDDVDQALFDEIANRIHEETKIDPAADTSSVQRIREAAEKLKHDLSAMEVSRVSLPFIVADSSGPKHFEADFSREEFNKLLDPLFKRLFEPCQQALDDAELSPEDLTDVVLVGGSTRIPRVRELVESFFGKKPNIAINPDEAIATGAAIQSGVISGDIREVLLLDIIPLTLGIELAGGVFKPMIERNSTIPCQAEKNFTTVVDNQANIMVRVLQGERRIASENHFLAQFKLLGIPPAPKEIPEIQVSFAIDANGILDVSAMDLSTGLETKVSVENYGNIGISDEDVERRVKDAESKVEEDEQFIRFAETRTKAFEIQKRVDQLFELAPEIISERHMKTLKESVFKLDLAIDRYDGVEVNSLIEKIKELLMDYSKDPDFQRALRNRENVSLMEDDAEFESAVIINDNIRPSSSEMDLAEIEAELQNLMAAGEEKLKAIEKPEETVDGPEVPGESASSEEDTHAPEPDVAEEPVARPDTKSVNGDGDDAAIASDGGMNEEETIRRPAASPSAKKANSKPSDSDKKQKRKFAFAPPSVEFEDPDDDDDDFDVSAMPPPPAP